MHQQQTAFENIVGKEEIALLNQKVVTPFVNIFDIISLFVAELEGPKIPCEVKKGKIPEHISLLIVPVCAVPTPAAPGMVVSYTSLHGTHWVVDCTSDISWKV